MRNKFRLALTPLLLSMLAFQATPANGCSFSNDPYFTFTNHPDFPLAKYAAGELGVLQKDYARSYLLPAYHYLSGAPLSADEQKGLVDLWDYRLNSTDSSCNADTSAWLKERATVPGASKIDSIDTERPISKDEAWQTYCNCQTNAFQTATSTLKELVTRYGADSEPVRQWLSGQDMVFSNCGYPSYAEKPKPAEIPSALPDSTEPALQKQRAYQIAAANFYAQNFEQARQQFDAITQDSASPWHKIAAYLAIRSMLRQSSLGKQLNTSLLQEASERIKKLRGDSEYADMAQDLTGLDSFIQARLSPEKHLQALAMEKLSRATAGEITKTIDNLAGENDDGKTTYASLSASVKAPDMIDWVMTYQLSDDAAVKHASERWSHTHSLPWLVAAANIAKPDEVVANAVIAAAKDQSSPAHWTLFYHSNRLQLAQGKKDSVRTALDQVLNAPPENLPLSGLNALKTQRLMLARDLNEFVRFGVQTPVCICTSGGVEQVPDDLTKLEKGGAKPEAPVFTPESGNIMDNKLPLSLLQQLAINKALKSELRGNVAWTSWVRAVLIGDDASARSLAEIARPFNKAKDKYFASYLAAGTPAARQFAAVFLMLHFSSAQPNPSWGPLQEDAYGDASGWWWSEKPVATFDENADGWGPSVHPFDPQFLTAAQIAQSKQELTKLAAVKTAPNFFSQTVFAWAKAHPDDERVPEALAWTVKATHYGSTDSATGAYSKEAFQLLHTRYKTSPWTKKTPYYY